MLRPAVAARNCAKPGKTIRLDIRRRCLSLKKPDPAVAGPIRCPGGRGPSTRLAKQRYCGGCCGRDPMPEPGCFSQQGISSEERAYSRTKSRFLVIYFYAL